MAEATLKLTQDTASTNEVQQVNAHSACRHHVGEKLFYWQLWHVIFVWKPLVITITLSAQQAA